MKESYKTPSDEAEPYAFSLLRRFRAGETAAQIAAAEGIPTDRVEIRLRAAVMVEKMRARAAKR